MVDEQIEHDQPNTDTDVLQCLGTESYTGRLLHHANHKHVHLTTRRRFIGPVPEGWLKSNRKSWLKPSTFVARRRASISIDTKTTRKRRLTGFDGPSTAATYRPSFPQPDDIKEDEEADEEETTEADSDVTETGSRDAVRSLGLSSSNQQAEENETSTAKAIPGHSFSVVPDISRSAKDGGQSSKVKDTAKSRQSSSYETAAETLATLDRRRTNNWQSRTPSDTSPDLDGQLFGSPRVISLVSSGNGSGEGNLTGPDTSTASLLRKDQGFDISQASMDTNQLKAQKSTHLRTRQKNTNYNFDGSASGTVKQKALHSGPVHFNLQSSTLSRQLNQNNRLHGGIVKHKGGLKKYKSREGQIIKMERMLVRIDATIQPLSKNFDENENRKIDTKLVQKWKEFMIVCREGDGESADLILQIYKTRVIPATNELGTKKKAKHEIVLDRRESNVNLYSSLDKSLVIWALASNKTTIYILKSRSGSSAVEWYTFLRKAMGWQRPCELPISVPDIGVSMRVRDPFEGLESLLKSDAENEDHDILLRTMHKEQAVATEIVKQSVTMLMKQPQWQDVVESWLKNEKLGLAWRRYDRLEWIHGLNERKMYGTMAMLRTHELELRPKKHYATEVVLHNDKVLVEPVPIEGFLIRLTTQKGSDRSIGRMYFKRLYFSTHDQFLFFSRPVCTRVPSHPKISSHNSFDMPTPQQISGLMPKSWDVDTFPLNNERISWLEGSLNETELRWREYDRKASKESQRKIQNLIDCDGYIDLCNVRNIRHVVRGAVPTDANVEEGSDVDFDMDVPDTRQEDGSTKDFADERTFELKMKNGLVVRLQAHGSESRKEWMKCLRNLVIYWKRRTKVDIGLYKLVKRTNLERLGVDEENEAHLGQSAQKWELTKSFASAELYNLCGIANCRTIRMSGSLFLKQRRHASFNRCSVILCYGKLLIFRDTLRTRSGKALPHVHHDRANTLDLKECYIYSGVLVESDLLNQNYTFDQNNPGRHTLPRIFVDDDWTSVDEEYMTCFVLWHGKRRSFFRSSGEDDDVNDEQGGGSNNESRRSRLKLVSQLGATGRSIVFKCRSRAERDHWVMAISLEIERLQQSEDVRITGDA